MLPTCSGKLRGDLRAVPHKVLVPVLSETVVSIIIHAIVILFIIKGIGCNPVINIHLPELLSLEITVHLFTRILEDGLTTEAMPLEIVMVWPPLVVMVFISKCCFCNIFVLVSTCHPLRISKSRCSDHDLDTGAHTRGDAHAQQEAKDVRKASAPGVDQAYNNFSLFPLKAP